MTTITMPSPLGLLRLHAGAGALTAVQLPGEDAPPASAADAAIPPDHETIDEPILRDAARQLAEYFAGERREFALPLAPRGTEFQQRVWRALIAIPFGATRSYGEQARAIGRPSASRAVGAANGQNPIAIIVPCHRVIGASGALTGYAGGLAAKRWLLAHEARFTPAVQTSWV